MGKWLKLGAIKVGKTGKDYLSLGSPKAKEPITVELVVKDAAGTVLATVTNPHLNIQNPRNIPGASEEQIARVPEWLKAEISLAPARD